MSILPSTSSFCPQPWGLLFSYFYLSQLSSLKDDDLAGRVGLQVKELNKLMANLEKDGLIKS